MIENEDKKPRISVLMPVYNGARYLSEAIESVLNQTFSDFEFLIVNDGSIDNSAEVIEKYAKKDSRIRLIDNAKEKGVVGALNTGIEKAQGEYIARMDSDDISLPERFEKQVSFMELNPDVCVCGTWVELFGNHNGDVWKLETDFGSIKSTMLFCGAVAHPTVMMRKKTILDGNFFYDNDYRHAEDYELWVRMAKAEKKIVNIPEILFRYRTHSENVGTVHLVEQQEVAAKIRIGQINDLGIEPSENEKDIHEKISNSRYGVDKKFQKNSHEWLNKLVKSNDKVGIYDKRIFLQLIKKKKADIESAYILREKIFGKTLRITWETIKDILKKILQERLVDFLANSLAFCDKFYRKKMLFVSNSWEFVMITLGRRIKLKKKLTKKIKIGLAVLAHERPEYLKLCLDSLFKTNLHDYDVTFLISDDGSTDLKVREIINKPRDVKYKIIRNFTPKGHNSWAGAFNKAVKKLLELDNFDIIGTCDSDAVSHPEWLDKTMKTAIWAKEHHKTHILGPFSSFNSSDYKFHRILGRYNSPHGKYVVKERMGALNYFYFKDDFLKLGYYSESKDDETLMTEKFKKMKVRYFSTDTSYAEHIGQLSILNQWRPVPVAKSVYGMNLAGGSWGVDMEKISPYGYYKYLKKNNTFGKRKDIYSNVKIDVLIPAIKKDLNILPKTVRSIRANLNHPLGDIIIAGPKKKYMIDFCERNGCVFKDEDELLPIKLKDINYKVGEKNRSGWIFQQLIKLNADKISDKKFVYVIDADTILTQPQKFEKDGESVLLASDEYHYPYYETFEKIFGYPAPAKVSFVAHQIFFDTHMLRIMKQEIEKKNAGKKWYEVILESLDGNEISSFSEYETYGNWMVRNNPDRIRIEYWFNGDVNFLSLFVYNFYPALFKRYRSISSHIRG